MASEKLTLALQRRLPPLNALRAFEAAARHENLARAADELGVTPGAVSQQIRQLEELLGVELFRRQPRGVTLTEDAAAVYPLISDAFERLREAGEALAGAGDHAGVRVGAPGGFAARWLAPRLAEFERDATRCVVTLVSDAPATALQRSQIELEIRFGRGGYAGCETRRLLSETVSPGVAPALLAELRGASVETVLSTLPLVHDASATDDAAHPDWQDWLRARGIARADAARGDRYSSPEQVVDAVAAGRGVGLVRRSLAQREVADGRIEILTTGGLTTLSDAYDLVWLKGRAMSGAARAFRDWVLAQAAPFENMGV